MTKCGVIEIDAVLPQTQCGLCGYGGCMPYAKAMSEDNAPINLCPPGGVDTLHTLAVLLNQDASTYVDDMRAKEKPAMIAAIRETECIGCTKCISACPVDAIIGSAKSMHVILTDACTGCELCVPPCPVDCIDMLPIATPTTAQQKIQRDRSRKRFQKRESRLQKELERENNDRIKEIVEQKKAALQSYVAAALSRAKKKS